MLNGNLRGFVGVGENEHLLIAIVTFWLFPNSFTSSILSIVLNQMSNFLVLHINLIFVLKQ
jgi:hypothetical protein